MGKKKAQRRRQRKAAQAARWTGQNDTSEGDSTGDFQQHMNQAAAALFELQEPDHDQRVAEIQYGTHRDSIQEAVAEDENADGEEDDPMAFQQAVRALPIHRVRQTDRESGNTTSHPRAGDWHGENHQDLSPMMRDGARYSGRPGGAQQPVADAGISHIQLLAGHAGLRQGRPQGGNERIRQFQQYHDEQDRDGWTYVAGRKNRHGAPSTHLSVTIPG